MPAAAVRCRRCATILRNRPICPSCGMESDAPGAAGGNETAAAAASGAATVVATPKRAAGKPGMKMCPVCFSTVAEETLVEHAGQRICPDCQRNLAKPAKEE